MSSWLSSYQSCFCSWFIALIAATLKLLKALTRVPSAAIRCLRAVYDRLTVLRSEPRSPDDATDVSALPELDEDTLKSTLERVLGLAQRCPLLRRRV